MIGLQHVNDFVVRFANVNGSGSASANRLFAQSILRMGVPATPRNIFPSNIQGLPTWYEVRISEAGHLGARGGTDLMVAMNPQTFDKDVEGIEPGGYLFYDNTKPARGLRHDITVLGVPLTEICNREYADARQRQLFKNIIYVGALSALLDIDMDGAGNADRRAVQIQGKTDPGRTFTRCGSGATGRWRTWPARSGCGCSARTRSATKSSSRATRRRRLARCTAGRRCARGIRSRRRRRSPRRFLAMPAATGASPRQATCVRRWCRPRTSWPRSAW